MNKKFLALSAIAATFLFSGCQKEKEVAVDNSGLTHTVVFTAEKAGETRTAIASEDNGYVTYKWISGDKERMHIYEKAADAEKATEGTITSMELANNGETATFYVTFTGDAPTGSVTYSATYGGVVSSSGHNPFIPDEQKPGVDTFDPDADALVADEIVKDGRDEDPSFKFKMHRMASLNKMTLKGMPAGDVIESVTFESDQTHYGYAQPDGSFTNGGKKLVMKYTENNTVPASGEFPVYFTTAPVTDATFTVTVKTDKGRYVKESTKKISFAVGQVRRFGVDMTGTLAPEGRTFTLVESVNDLVLGSDIVIAADGVKNIAMSIFQNTNNRRETEATKSDDRKTLTITDDVQVFTLQEGTKEGTYAFLCVNGDTPGYICAASSSSNYLKTKTTLDDNGSWTIAISEMSATVTAQGSFTRNILKYNSSNKLFSCYASGQQPVYLYQAAGLPDPGMSWSVETATATITSTGIQFTAPTLTKGNASDVSYSSSDEAVATIDNEGAVSILGAGTTVITASFAGNNSFAAASASYTLTVTDSRDKVATPTFNPTAGAVAAGTEVTISTTTEGATIYYTIDGTDPTTASTQGTTVTIDEAMTVRAIAVKENYINSDIASATYSLTTPDATISTILADNIGSGTKHYDVSGVTVMANQGKNYVIGDVTGVMLMYYDGSPALVVGNVYDVQGDVKMYNGVHEFSYPTVQNGTGTAVEAGTPEEMTAASLTAYASAPVTKYAKLHFVEPATGYECTDGTNIVNVLDGSGYFNTFRERPVIATGYLIGYFKGKIQFLVMGIMDDEDTPFLSVKPTELMWDADEYGEDSAKRIEIDLNYAATGYTVTGSSTDWVIEDDESGVLTVYPNAANTSTTADKVFEFTIAHGDDATLTQTVKCTQAKVVGGTTETLTGTFVFSSTDSDSSLTLTTESGLIVTQAQGTGSNAVNSSYNTPSTLRIYKGHTLSFSGKTITKIAITVKQSYYGDSLEADCGTLTPTSSSGGTIVWEGESSSVTITNVGTNATTQVRPASIVVTYK